MTMILTCLTKDYIVQASDRRLTVMKNGKLEVDEDHSNKALIYGNHFVFAYTGLAKLPVWKNMESSYQYAIDWAAQQLSEGKNVGDAVSHLRNCVTEFMNSNRVRKLPERVRRLAFVGAGFDDIESGGKRSRRPLRIVISNFIEDDGTLLDQPSNVFSVKYGQLLKNHGVELFVAGLQLSEERRIEFTRLLKRCVRHKVRPETIGCLLTQEIQAIADKKDSVGKNIMCTFVPRERSAAIT